MDLSGKEFPHKKALPSYPKIEVLKHIVTMIDEIEEFLEENRMEKAFRWLGFMQGCMWTLGLYTLDELKNHNRP